MKKAWIVGLIIVLILIGFVVVGSVKWAGGMMVNAGGKSAVVFEHEFDVTGIKSIEIGYVSEQVIFYQTEGNQIKIVEHLNQNTNNAASTSLTNGTLNVTGDKRRAKLHNLFSFNFKKEWIEVYIPASYEGALSISTVSGSIDTEDEWKLSAFSGKSTSGNIELEGMSAETLYVSCVSGNLDIKEISGSGDLKTTSGNIDAECIQIKGTLSLATVSGNIQLTVPKESSFDFNANSVSGRIRTDFDKGLSYNKNKKNASGSYGNGGDNAISAGTVSGNIEISF